MFGIPENWFGIEPTRARTDAVNRRYAGLYYRLNGVRRLADGGSEPVPYEKVQNAATDLWREYLEVELVCPLEQGKQYTLTFYASLAEISTRALRLEARLSPEPYLTVPFGDCQTIPDDDGPTAKVGIPYTNGAKGEVYQSGHIGDKNGWTKLTHTFTAKGGERYLTIGNFEERPIALKSQPAVPDCVPAYSSSNAIDVAYYYIDDVRLSQSIDCFCKENDQAFRAKLVKIDSEDPSQCCYSFQLSNGGVGSAQYDCLYGACSIYGVELLKPGGSGADSEVVFSWKSSDPGNNSPMKEPITADNQWHELGTLCVPVFRNTEERTVVVAIKGQDGNTLCKEQITYTGCKDICGCDDFNRSVVVSLADSLDKCCFAVSIDASKLKGGCEIRSVDVYEGTGLTEKVTSTFRPDNPVSNSFSGVLFTFCRGGAGVNFASASEIVFRDATGTIICRKSVDLYCDCDCSKRPPGLKIEFASADQKNGKCCYSMSFTEITACDFALKNLEIQTDESVDVTTENSWKMTRTGTSLILTDVSVEGNLRNRTIGSICVSPCMTFDPHALNIKALISTNGLEGSDVECEVPVEITHGELVQCRGSKSCDDVILSVVKPITFANPTVDDCCRKVLVHIRGCTLTNSSLLIDIRGPNGIPLKTTNLGGGMFESAPLCRSYRAGETFTVDVRDIHGKHICTKTISLPNCTRQETNQ
ncbi:MAG: hypothetical protein FGM32_11610 [Candidatus Kapabacteria bacterium]|nr:hypothetical protein [Candidatus Kapabacteria bacterium]